MDTTSKSKTGSTAKPAPILSVVDRAWFGCAIDAEGSISIIYDKGYRVFLQVENACRKFVEKCKELTKAGYVWPRKRPALGWKTVWYWRTEGFKAIRSILKQVLPYLIVKIRQARIALQFIEQHLRGKSVGQYQNRLRVLNRRGLFQ